MRGCPGVVKEAIQDAMEAALENVPSIAGKVYVLPDVSGSMQSPVTGVRGSATTSVRCVDVAALVAAAILRKNTDAEVIPFSDRLVPVELNPRDSVMTNAAKLAAVPAGGTNCTTLRAHAVIEQGGGDGAIAHALEFIFWGSSRNSWDLVIAGETGLIAAAPPQQARSATDPAPDSPMAPPRLPKSNSAASR